MILRVLPDEQWLKELQHDDEAQGHEDQSQVQQQHQAAHALHVGAEGVRGRHGVYLHPRLEK